MRPLAAGTDEAPAFDPVTDWINTDTLSLDALDDQIVLLAFWTYNDIHCLSILPRLNRLADTYDNVAVIGVHSPEFAFERHQPYVEHVIDTYDVTFPVALDPENTLWKQYGNQYRPRHALIDRQSTVAYDAIGADALPAVEERIRRFLRHTDSPADAVIDPDEQDTAFDAVSPAVYTGDDRNTGLGNEHVYAPYVTITYRDSTDSHRMNTLYLQGDWRQDAEYVTYEGGEHGGYATVRCMATRCGVVLGPDCPPGDTPGERQKLYVDLDDDPVPAGIRGADIEEDDTGTYVTVDRPRLYDVVERDAPEVG